MNLADIRKKAHVSRAGVLTEQQAAAASVSVLSVKVGNGAAGGILQDTENVVVETLAQERSVGADSAGTFPADYDPLAVLLAGREAADTVEDSVTDVRHEHEAAELKYLRFRVADEEYGVSLLEIREIIKPRTVTAVPRMPGFVAGVISLRGTIIPVIDVRVRLGLTTGPVTGRERIIVARTGDGSAGLLVDEVYQVVGLAEDAIDKAPAVLEEISRDFVRGVARLRGRILILLALEHVVDVSLVCMSR
jgi:purine-binding chemotaxis protein CheW